MTEAEWFACDDARRMLVFLRGKASDRKLRLIACACYQDFIRLVDAPGTPPPNRAVAVAERLADGKASELARDVVWLQLEQEREWDEPYNFAQPTVLPNAFEAAIEAAWHAASIIEGFEGLDWNACGLIREAVGNPFRPAALDPTWLTPALVTLAQSIYEQRAFDRMPELAGALERAGCDNVDILAHCRGPGPHVRGCWVVDLVLGKS